MLEQELTEATETDEEDGKLERAATRLNEVLVVKMISGKSVYVVESHHKALAAWAIERRKLDIAPNLLTIDHHTDTYEAFLHHAHWAVYNDGNLDAEALRQKLSQQLDWRNDASVLSSIELLHHDEHIHAATQCGILDNAFCIQLSDSDGWPSIEDQERDTQIRESFRLGVQGHLAESGRPMTYRENPDSIYVVGHNCAIGCVKRPHDDDCQVSHSSEIIESNYLEDQLARIREIFMSLGNPGIEESVYILDIDLDVFHTAKSIEPDDPSVFYQLIRGAVAITIATEADCVEELWLDDARQMRMPELLDRTLSHIEAALRTVGPMVSGVKQHPGIR